MRKRKTTMAVVVVVRLMSEETTITREATKRDSPRATNYISRTFLTAALGKISRTLSSPLEMCFALTLKLIFP